MCAPIDSRRRPERVERVASGGQLVERDAELRVRCAGGEVRMGVGGDARVDADPDPPAAGSQQRLERAERLGVDERATAERGREIGVGLADSVDDDPSRVGAGPQRERELDRPDDLEAEALGGEPSQERGIGVGLDRVGDERAWQGIAPRLGAAGGTVEVGDVERRPEALRRLDEQVRVGHGSTTDQWSGASTSSARQLVGRGGSTRSARSSNRCSAPSGPASVTVARSLVHDRADQSQVVHARQPEPASELDLRDLGRRGPRRAAAQVLGIELPGEVEIGEAGALVRRHASVDDPVGQAHEVRREAMAAEVRALPGAFGVLVGQGERQRPAAQRAARVATPVRADEQDRIGQVGAELVERHRGQGLDVEVSGTANGPHGHRGGLGVDEDRAAHRVVSRVTLVPPDELQAQAEALRGRGRIGAEALGDGIGPPRRSVLEEQPAPALVDGAGEGLAELLGQGRAAHRCGERHSAWAGISRRFLTGEKRTGRKARLVPDRRHPQHGIQGRTRCRGCRRSARRSGSCPTR